MDTLDITTDVVEPRKTRKRLLLKWSIAITAVLFAYLAWQCGTGLIEGHKLADQAVGRFHNALNEGNYEQIYSAGDVAFQTSDTQEELIKIFETVHRKLGNCQSSSLTNLNVNATTNGTLLTTQYGSNYAGGQATETFVWLKKNGELKLYNYNIQSKAFLLDK
jgi:hypothetical protein